jgi:hypothetical protein
MSKLISGHQTETQVMKSMLLKVTWAWARRGGQHCGLCGASVCNIFIFIHFHFLFILIQRLDPDGFFQAMQLSVFTPTDIVMRKVREQMGQIRDNADERTRWTNFRDMMKTHRFLYHWYESVDIL